MKLYQGITDCGGCFSQLSAVKQQNKPMRQKRLSRSWQKSSCGDNTAYMGGRVTYHDIRFQ